MSKKVSAEARPAVEPEVVAEPVAEEVATVAEPEPAVEVAAEPVVEEAPVVDQVKEEAKDLIEKLKAKFGL